MDLALGIAFAGYHLWKYRRRPQSDIERPYLLNIPAEVRLIIYEFVFDDADDADSAPAFLEPLLTCRLVHDESFQLAFSRARFAYVVPVSQPPFWTPRSLKLPASKLARVRHIDVEWCSCLVETKDLRRFFSELAHGPLRLSRLTFTITNPHALAPFRFKYASLFPGVREFGQYVTEELPLMGNVDKIVFASPSVESKRSFQLLFDPKKPRLVFGDLPLGVAGDSVKKNLGDWDYAVVRAGKDIRQWRLELVHPSKGMAKRGQA